MPLPKLLNSPPNGGFALVIALSLMAFVLLLLLSITTLVQVETQGAQIQMQKMEAEQAALLGLQVALGELQLAVGPDQRVTAVADIYANDSSKAPAEGRNRWVGVWDTSNYNPASPNVKTFKGWLVSCSTPSGLTSDADAQNAAIAKQYRIFEAADASGNPDPSNDVVVEKVSLSTAGSLNEGFYAYWVEDEGVKADMAWNEGSFNDDERKQAVRLSSSPGVDYGVLTGDAASPFNGKVTYPIDSTGNSWLADLGKAVGIADLPLVTDSTIDATNWLKNKRHDITLGSRGILADSKNGGLRRDLSLAFEMDGTKEAENATRFNQQNGEFVGNGDTLSAPAKPKGLPVTERFLWRDYANMPPDTGTPFASSIPNSPNSRNKDRYLRGPNWWALRDYANLYKRLSGTNGDYTMAARAYFPNRSTERLAYSDYHSHINETQSYGIETGVNDSNPTQYTSSIDSQEPARSEYYLYRPARPNYAPVNLGTSVLVSIQAKNITGVYPDERADLAIGLDPLFYFWNPYNRAITCENIAVVLARGLPGRVVFDVTTDLGVPTGHYDLNIATMLANNATYSNGSKIIFLIKGPLQIEPGEVVIASPIASASGSGGSGEAVLGYATDNDSGIIMTEINPGPLGNGRINLRLDDEVSFSFLRSGNATSVGLNGNTGSSGTEVRHEMDTSLPSGTAVTPESIAADMTLLGEQTQHTLQILWSGPTPIADEYVSPGGFERRGLKPKVRTETVGNIVNSKAIFGAHSLLIKPASPGGLGNPKPYEMFTRFNPAPMLMKRDYYARCNPNQIYRHVTAGNTLAVMDDGGISFSGAPRNTFWGLSYDDSGSIAVPVSNIPSGPLFSLASFSDANLSIVGTDPFHAVGNSWSSPLITPSSAYELVKNEPVNWAMVGQDFSWLINDALFDSYYLSGIAPDFTIGTGGYSANGSTLTDTLDDFFGVDHRDARANPALTPYLPEGTTVAQAVAALAADDGYRKMGAYSLINGAFNVNSTSVAAWAALLRVNRNLTVNYSQSGGSESTSGTPFPSSESPINLTGAEPQWSGFSRITDKQIWDDKDTPDNVSDDTGLAVQIVNQVKLRAPFMGLSDFVNHQMGPIDPATSYTGALQAALDLAAGGGGINAVSRTAAQGTEPRYPSDEFNSPTVLGTGTKVTTGIPGDITQANLLLPIAPRLAARSDTFRIRAYGSVQDSSGNDVASAICEAVVQRVPEYMDGDTSATGNDAWDDSDDLTSGTINEQFGRRFKIESVRWLTPDEV